MSGRDAVAGLGEKMLAARSAAGLTLAQTAERSDVPAVNISRFENGHKVPTLATLYRLARAYGVNVCELLPADAHTKLPANDAVEAAAPPAFEAEPPAEPAPKPSKKREPKPPEPPAEPPKRKRK